MPFKDIGVNGPDPRGCHNEDPFQTTVRGLATYTIPKVDVQVSATVRSQPPSQLTAGWQVPNTVIQSALGHLPANALASGNTTIQLIDNSNKLFVDNRRTQIDMRFAKVLRLGRTRSDIGIDLNNLLNTNYATGYNTTYIYNTDNTRITAIRSMITASGRNASNVEFIASEINVSNHPSNNTPTEATMGHALGTVEEVFSLARLGVRDAHYWLWPADPLDGTEQPVFKAYRALTNHMGDTILNTYANGNANSSSFCDAYWHA